MENNAIKKGGFIILNRPKNHTQDILTVLKSRQPWLIATFSALIYFALEYFSENEGRMLLATKGVDIIDASYIISISWLGYAIGNPLLGALSDVTEKRTSFMKLCALTTIIAFFLIKTFVNINVLKLAFFSLGVAASGQTIALATMAEQFKPQFVAIGYGLNNTAILIFSSVFSPFIGGALDIANGSNMAQNIDYSILYSLLLIMSILCLAVSFLVKETFKKKTIGFTILCRSG